MSIMSALPTRVIVFAFAVATAWLAARVFAGRLPGSTAKAAGTLVLDAVLAGLVAARLVFIAIWWREYTAAPLSMLAIGDGGFHAPAGFIVTLAWAGWKSQYTPALRKPVWGALFVGLLTWSLIDNAPALLRQATPSMPDLILNRADYTDTVALSDFAGQPVVINLWATWCPPCRREMPVLQQAEADYPDVAFILINQGETARQIQSFLESERLNLNHVLLDPFSSAMRKIGARGLPTTLYFDAEGRLVDSHLGELTTPSLRDTLQRRFDQNPPPNPIEE